MLECHGYTMKNNTISTLRLVKDEVLRVGGVLKFPITKDLMEQVKGSRAKYTTDLEQQKALEEKEKKEREDAAAIAEVTQNKENKLDEVDSKIRKCELSVKAANEIIEDGNKKLQEALLCKKLDRNIVQSAQSKIEIGLERKRKCENDLVALKEKRLKLNK